MAEGMRTSAGAWGPRELETMVGAYRAILQEICETGCLAGLSTGPISALDIRRLAAKQVIVAAAIGLRTQQELVSQALARMTGARPAPS